MKKYFGGKTCQLWYGSFLQYFQRGTPRLGLMIRINKD